MVRAGEEAVAVRTTGGVGASNSRMLLEQQQA